MTREQFIKTCALLGLALPAFTSIVFSSTFEYDKDAERIIKEYITARAKYNLEVTDDEKTAIRMWVKSCKQSKLWDSLEVMYCFTDPTTAHINLAGGK